jgi:Protein of unknown function (DUF1553)/Protein of unknown function (DUF1549)
MDWLSRVDVTGKSKEPALMVDRRSSLCLLVIACWAAGADGAGDRPPRDQIERAMTSAIDEHLARGWADSGVEPAARSSDAEFLRRVSLDLAGKIPTVAEARAFLDDPDPEKRRKLAERIVEGPSAANHFVNTWRPLLIPGATAINTRLLVPDVENWLRGRFSEQIGFDQSIRDLLTYPLVNAVPVQIAIQQGSGPTPLAFYAIREYKPEELASATARLFLGVRIECAQCHDHPFATWKRDQFWEFAASFGGITRQGPANANVLNARVVERKGRAELTIPGTSRTVQARFLDGSRDDSDQGGGRESLAAWITSPSNPYFAKAIVNRAWAQLFGIGIVDPVDDFADSNPPSHPELLDDLARQFVDSGYNLPLLFRAIVASRAYQLTSAGPPERSDDPRLFARMAIKGMSGEQWYDSLAQAIGLPPEPANRNPRIVGPATPRAAFLEKFASGGDKAIDRPTSILQALTLMHGTLVSEGTDPRRGATLGAISSAPFLDSRGRVEVLYLAALSRPPRPDELERMVDYVEARRVPKDALADVFWAILNGAEFALNH